MGVGEVKVTASQLKRRKKISKIAKITLIVLVILLTIVYIILGIIYNGGRFTVTLDPNFSLKSGIVMYENSETKDKKNRLYAKEIDFMDNISIKWINPDIDNESDGSHNGQNYIAYTFYLENEGPEVMNYWMECTFDDVIKNVDEAVRIMVILNGEKTVYGKTKSSGQGKEKDCDEEFLSATIVMRTNGEKFKPKDRDKFTVVIWLEGNDPDCVDKIIGGTIKFSLNFKIVETT